MLPFTVAHESIYFTIPAAKRNDIAAWVRRADEIYMQDEINRCGFSTVINTEGRPAFQHLTEVSNRGRATVPYYGTFGGAYHFYFTAQVTDTLLRVEHFSGNSLDIKPYEIDLGTRAQFMLTEQQTRHWDENRLELLLEDHSRDFRFFIDGEIYANLLSSGWDKRGLYYYCYEFVPMSVGCRIIIHHIPSSVSTDLTANVEW